MHVSTSKTSELRREDDPFDHSRRKGDLTATGLFGDGADILDVGVTHPTIDSSISSLSSKVRATGANAYATAKERRAISAKKELYATAQLDLRRKPFQELSISELFSQLPTALCLGG